MTIHSSRASAKVFKKNNKTVTFENKNKQKFLHADLDEHLPKCLERCDGFVRKDTISWLVELKGRHVEKAINQIISTTKVMSAELSGSICVPVIVAQGCPKVVIKAKYLVKLRKESAVPISDDVVMRSRSCELSI